MLFFALLAVLANAIPNPYPRTLTLIAGVGYVILFFTVAIDRLRKRRSRDFIQGVVLHELFSQINEEIFDDDDQVRFTLFKRSTFNREYIVPWYRFQKGIADPIKAVVGSKARYRMGEGFTGIAWANAGRELFCAVLPEFSSRKDFEAYYSEVLGIDPRTVEEISDFMIGVQTIFSYGFVSADGESLGVLSMDLPTPVNADDLKINAGTITSILRSIGAVLESFKRAERK